MGETIPQWVSLAVGLIAFVSALASTFLTFKALRSSKLLRSTAEELALLQEQRDYLRSQREMLLQVQKQNEETKNRLQELRLFSQESQLTSEQRDELETLEQENLDARQEIEHTLQRVATAEKEIEMRMESLRHS